MRRRKRRSRERRRTKRSRRKRTNKRKEDEEGEEKKNRRGLCKCQKEYLTRRCLYGMRPIQFETALLSTQSFLPVRSSFHIHRLHLLLLRFPVCLGVSLSPSSSASSSHSSIFSYSLDLVVSSFRLCSKLGLCFSSLFFPRLSFISIIFAPPAFISFILSFASLHLLLSFSPPFCVLLQDYYSEALSTQHRLNRPSLILLSSFSSPLVLLPFFSHSSLFLLQSFSNPSPVLFSFFSLPSPVLLSSFSLPSLVLLSSFYLPSLLLLPSFSRPSYLRLSFPSYYSSLSSTSYPSVGQGDG